MNNLEIRKYIKGFKKNINSKTSTEDLLLIQKEINDIIDSMQLSGATLLFLSKLKPKLKIAIKKSKRKEDLNLSYFENKEIQPSPAEVLIIKVLIKHKIKFLREVSFTEFTTPTGHHYRYDFYLPDKNILIEYDGKGFHNNNMNDKIKNQYAMKHKIKLIRYSAKHYYNLEKEICKLK